MKPTPITNYQQSSFSATTRYGDTITHEVYQNGTSRKIILLMQELPGITEPTLKLADRLVNRGFRVVLPHLVGPIGKKRTITNTVRLMCMRKEFHLFANGRSSPIVDWLAALCQHLKIEHNVPGIAVIGMCLTGDFAISLMANEAVLAAYASQPSLPLMGGTKLPFSGEEVTAIKSRLSTQGPMLCARFVQDFVCGAKKMKGLNQAFNTAEKELVKLDTINVKGRTKHSILTLHYEEKATHATHKKLEEVVDYFNEHLSESAIPEKP